MMQKKRKLILYLTSLTTVAILAARVFSSAQDIHNGVLLFGSKQNAGIVKQGADVQCEVSAFNLGVIPISISGQPDCGCTVAGAYDHTLLPFGWISLPLSISTEGGKEGLHARKIELRFKSGKTMWQRNATIQFCLTK